ncbi:hypothetical protein MMC13_007211 [Lambiella insularis]|nr:hypothetical protein [Lambiella insularis]
MTIPYYDKRGLLSLPNELLINILAPFSTQLLIPLAIVSHRFHNVVLRIVHTRLLLAASLKEHKLILECYHPSSKSTEPYLFCDYLGTPGLSDEKEGEGWAYDSSSSVGQIGRLGGLYSRFRPIRPEAEQRIFRPHPTGDVPGHPGTSTTYPSQNSLPFDEPESLVTHPINLDPHELFSQLCVVTNLVQLGPRRGVFYGFANVAEGVLRIWREWLASRAKADETRARKSANAPLDDLERSVEQSNPKSLLGSINAEDESRTLWIDSRRNVGIRVLVKERKWRREVPILLHRDEDPAVSYELEYEELQVRTNHLLLAVERMLLEHENASGKAMIFGSFVSRSVD